MNTTEKPFYLPLLDKQRDGYEYLADWLYKWRLSEINAIAREYRGNNDVTPISLCDMLEYWDASSHEQQGAFLMLDDLYATLPEDVVAEFLRLFHESDMVHDSNLGKTLFGAPRPEYQTQRNNPTYAGMHWGNTCNASSVAMWLQSLELAGKIQPDQVATDEELIKLIYNYGYNSSTDHGAVTNVLRDKLGVKSTFLYTATWSDLKAELKAGSPVVLGILHKGPWSAATGFGHMVMGYALDKAETGMIGHDPWGKLPYYSDYNGADVFFDYEKTLLGRWQLMGASNGYMRVFVD